MHNKKLYQKVHLCIIGSSTYHELSNLIPQEEALNFKDHMMMKEQNFELIFGLVKKNSIKKNKQDAPI